MRHFSRSEKMSAKYRENPTPPQQSLRTALCASSIPFKFQFQVPILNYIVDFYSPELNFGIEVDGNFNKLSTNRRRDLERDTRLWDEAGIVIMRIAAAAIHQDVDAVIGRIENVIQNIETLDNKSPLLRCKAKTTQLVQYTPAEKQALIKKLEKRGKIGKRRYTPC